LEVRCAICSKKEEITKIHKDFQRIRQEPKLVYICSQCSKKVKYQAREEQKPKKPL